MKKKIFYGVAIAAVSCMSIVNTGCSSGTDQAATGATTDSMALQPKRVVHMPANLAAVAGDGTSGWQAPPYNASVAFGTWGGSGGNANTCKPSPSLCGATAGINSVNSGTDSTTVLVSFVTFAPTIGNLGLCMVVNQGDTTIKLNSALTSYFDAYNTNNGTGQCSPGVYQYGSQTKLDPNITQPLKLADALINTSVLCAVAAPSMSYWTVFFYGLYDGSAGNIQFAMPGSDCNQSQGLAICKVSNYTLGMINPNAVYFSTNYDSQDSTTMSVNMMFNMDTLISQQPDMAQYFVFGQPGMPQVTFSQDYTFPTDPSLQKSTGIPGGTIIPAGSYDINQNFSVSYPDNTLQFTGWISVTIPHVKVVQQVATDTKMKKKK